jgi:hypothetical protein
MPEASRWQGLLRLAGLQRNELGAPNKLVTAGKQKSLSDKKSPMFRLDTSSVLSLATGYPFLLLAKIAQGMTASIHTVMIVGIDRS